jgi:FMN reductase
MKKLLRTKDFGIGQVWKAFSPEGKLLDTNFSQQFDQFT